MKSANRLLSIGWRSCIHLIARLRCSALRHFCLLWLLLTSHSSLLLRLMKPPVRPHGISPCSFLVYPPDLRIWVTATFTASLYSANLPAIYAFYRVSVRRATISLSLLLACTPRYKPWEPLTNSLVTTPMWTFTTEYGHARHTEERFQGYP